MAATTISRQQREAVRPFSLFREIIVQGMYFIVSLLVSIGTSIGDISPFPPALVAAVPLKFAGITVLGGSLGYIITNPREAFRYIGVLVAISALKWLLSDIKKVVKNPFFAPLLAFVPMVATGITLLFVSTSSMSRFSVCLIEALLSAVAAYFINRTVELSTEIRSLVGFSQQEISCLCVTGCILIYSLGSVEIFTISIGRVLAVLMILMCAGYGGVGMGSISGIATGLLFSLGSTSMAFLSGAYAFGGLMAGLFSSISRLPSGVAFTLCTTVLSFASDDRGLILSLFIESLLASGIYMLIPTRFGNMLSEALKPSVRKTETGYMREGVAQRLRHASEAIEGVTKCVQEVSEKLTSPSVKSPQIHVLEGGAEKTCKTCGMRVYCFKKERESTRRDFMILWDALVKDGHLSQKCIEETFSKKCCKSKELADNINFVFRQYTQQQQTRQRITQIRSVIAGQFSGLSVLLSDLSENLEETQYMDKEGAEKVIRGLHDINIVAIACTLTVNLSGRMVVDLTLKRGKKQIDIKDIMLLLRKCTGRRFERPVENYERGRLRLLIREKSVYEAQIGTSQHISGGGDICGDCCDYFENGEGSLIAVISDGMGTGTGAAVDSNMAVSILTRLLKAGLSYDSALSVVNSALMVKSEDESTATLDVTDINLFTGKISLYKAGAPMTFVRKGSKVYKRENPSLPVGILTEVGFSKDNMTLSDGDVMLMVSDGAVIGEERWLEDILREWEDAPASDLASLVVNEARKRRMNEKDDDITAIAIKIKKTAA